MTGKNPRPSLNFSCSFELASANIEATLDPPEKEKRRFLKRVVMVMIFYSFTPPRNSALEVFLSTLA